MTDDLLMQQCVMDGLKFGPSVKAAHIGGSVLDG
jgi:hypothetical protein